MPPTSRRSVLILVQPDRRRYGAVTDPARGGLSWPHVQQRLYADARGLDRFESVAIRLSWMGLGISTTQEGRTTGGK